MSDGDNRQKYLIVGRDRREKEESDLTPPPMRRQVMGRKGIGKFSALVVAATELGDGRILTTDQRDFNAYRWKNTKPFRNLLEL